MEHYNFKLRLLKFLNSYNNLGFFNDDLEFCVQDIISSFRVAGYDLPRYTNESQAISMILIRLKKQGYLKLKKVKIEKKGKLIEKVMRKNGEFIYLTDPVLFKKIRSYIEHKENYEGRFN